jgi:hypothetical protein
MVRYGDLWPSAPYKKDRVIPLPSVDHLLNAVIQPVAATPQLFNQSTSDIVAAERESCRLG